MNNIELWQGDCLELMKNIADNSVDMILTDPPYGTTACKWDSVIPFEPLWEQYNRIIKDNGAVVLFGSEPFSTLLRYSNLKMYKYDYVWIKTKAGNFALSRKNPMKLHENVMVFYKKFPTYNLWNLKKLDKPISSSRKNKGANLGHCVDKGGYEQTETGFHKTTLYFSNKSGKGYSFHPTQKPVDLLEYLIKTYTNEGDVVLDNCMGSGSTGVACVNTNRNFIGIELDKGYFDIAKERIDKSTRERG
jgi:site-specific DNA-methyltransferase (adenine-specific)